MGLKKKHISGGAAALPEKGLLYYFLLKIFDF